MPRRKRPRTRPRPLDVERLRREVPQPTTDQMARSLVERGLASSYVLGFHGYRRKERSSPQPQGARDE